MTICIGWHYYGVEISTHTPHTRRDRTIAVATFNRSISTHTPHTRRDIVFSAVYAGNIISTHTPHTRRDIFGGWLHPDIRQFLLTRLIRGVTIRSASIVPAVMISTHTPHTRRDDDAQVASEVIEISTHTPHTRRDGDIATLYLTFQISTHTPHTRRDGIRQGCFSGTGRFLLTRLIRGVTGFR